MSSRTQPRYSPLSTLLDLWEDLDIPEQSLALDLVAAVHARHGGRRTTKVAVPTPDAYAHGTIVGVPGYACPLCGFSKSLINVALDGVTPNFCPDCGTMTYQTQTARSA